MKKTKNRILCFLLTLSFFSILLVFSASAEGTESIIPLAPHGFFTVRDAVWTATSGFAALFTARFFALAPEVAYYTALSLLLLISLCFLLFTFNTWKPLSRILFYALGFLFGYFIGVIVSNAFTFYALPGADFVALFLPLILGAVFGIPASIFASFFLRLSLFSSALFSAVYLMPIYVTPHVADAFSGAPWLLPLLYIALGGVIGYLIAFPLMRGFMRLLSLLLAAVGLPMSLILFLYQPVSSLHDPTRLFCIAVPIVLLIGAVLLIFRLLRERKHARHRAILSM